MGLDKQPTPPPKKEDEGGQDIRISSTVPPGAQKARNGADDAIPGTSHLDEAEAQVREETAAVEGKARGGERQPQLTTADMLQRSDSPCPRPQAMRKTLKQMMKALQMMLAHKRRCPHPLRVRLQREMSLRPKTMGTMASQKNSFPYINPIQTLIQNT